MPDLEQIRDRKYEKFLLRFAADFSVVKDKNIGALLHIAFSQGFLEGLEQATDTLLAKLKTE